MKNKIDEADRTAFQEAMDDVAPLPQKRAAPYRKRRPPRPLNLSKPDDGFGDRDLYFDQEIEATDELSFSRPGVQKRVISELRRGRFEVGLELDLHGMNVSYARETLGLFLQECHRRRVRCARIIHGKGYGSADRQPVLKQKLNIWLRQRDDVLAFTSATRRDGGTGAAYVLLRTPKQEQWQR
ncbi:DNA mismatch repair protein MutS [Candidatus Endoriftia persephone str. Guaymas]|uniref:Smr protein/MutS2 n=1 Tax=endosymbiont of Riftia pachyptila (vent Ph05) TaxID=1048808 RepID=G2DDK3_9GAMM|nr:Smr/MutS family protein [endosymbiont of Riftia pachyptila]EGV51289.1 Smr protein/MutS2 [endosymbiont of Riftia pachyptila (vent Ph05)]MBA1330198.1 DNA mismatch repair protein MutS [Candidatus Endoriftia persephone str. Guaymas]